ncbi:2-vinyl bacteriochlorophyllide hydratase [Telmatospirillum siberiense]|uniref:2-vinyl bacteriochlorophyllide hydratase n=2 Tax=Telmatospirillum siberiense TaxID=382514 RepID=A0A2N3PTB9_9PROT|nr:2-vinyl bacteriochlorophyllide hydratase [Telmatospirillum siberiense]
MGAKLPFLDSLLERFSCCPWTATAGSVIPSYTLEPRIHPPIYTADERRRRDMTPWTTVQGVLAPIQFAVFLVSLALVLNYLATGHGYGVATASIVAKTVILYLIMVTGSIWEKKVFDRYLFAAPFFFEDCVSMLVLALHTAYLIALTAGLGSPEGRMLLALSAYATYAINAAQFLLKLRAARLEAADAVAKKSVDGGAK